MIYPLISIDLETTGLDAANCQILEFAAVIDTGEGSVGEQKYFQTYVSHEVIRGEPMGLAMNAEIIKLIADRPDGIRICCEEDIGPLFYKFLKDNNALGRPPAGKNFDKFDTTFLTRLPNFDMKWLHRRTIDPGSMYLRLDDDNVPSTAQCKERAGMETGVAHKALEDARDVAELIRRKIAPRSASTVDESLDAFRRGDYKTTTQLLSEIKATMVEAKRVEQIQAETDAARASTDGMPEAKLLPLREGKTNGR